MPVPLIRTLPIAALALTMAACGTTVTERAATGALGGAAVGAVVSGDTKGALVGAAVGGVAGAATTPRRYRGR
jgi:osmotically inducible lipoprotein OsmB